MRSHRDSPLLVPAAFAALLLGCSTAASESESFGSQSAKSDGFEGTWEVTPTERGLRFAFESPVESYQVHWMDGGALIEVHGDEGVTAFGMGPNATVTGPAPEEAARKIGDLLNDAVAFLGEQDPEAENTIRDALAAAARDPESSHAEMEALAAYLENRLGAGKADHDDKGITCDPIIQLIRALPATFGIAFACATPYLGGTLAWFVGAGDFDTPDDWADNRVCHWSEDYIDSLLDELLDECPSSNSSP